MSSQWSSSSSIWPRPQSNFQVPVTTHADAFNRCCNLELYVLIYMHVCFTWRPCCCRWKKCDQCWDNEMLRFRRWRQNWTRWTVTRTTTLDTSLCFGNRSLPRKNKPQCYKLMYNYYVCFVNFWVSCIVAHNTPSAVKTYNRQFHSSHHTGKITSTQYIVPIVVMYWTCFW